MVQQPPETPPGWFREAAGPPELCKIVPNWVKKLSQLTSNLKYLAGAVALGTHGAPADLAVAEAALAILLFVPLLLDGYQRRLVN